MKIIKKIGKEDIAICYIAETEKGEYIEFVESLEPPLGREQKWVLIISTLVGCPVDCPICDAGGNYKRKLGKEEMLAQIDLMVLQRFPNKEIPSKKFKIQFARMGEPSLNREVLDVLGELPERYIAPGLMPCISTVAPNGTDEFFEELLYIKEKFYPKGKFQLQFSIHTTDEKLRDKLIPVKKWDFRKISTYGEKFYKKGDRKITLNFALAKDYPIDPDILLKYFNPDKFLIKITPVNPTIKSVKNKVKSGIDVYNPENNNELIERFRKKGFEVILSIGELEENKIGSNCGQFVRRFIEEKAGIKESYSYVESTFKNEPEMH